LVWSEWELFVFQIPLLIATKPFVRSCLCLRLASAASSLATKMLVFRPTRHRPEGKRTESRPLPRNWFAPSGNNRSGGGGNKTAGASGVEGRIRRLGEPACCNLSER